MNKYPYMYMDYPEFDTNLDFRKSNQEKFIISVENRCFRNTDFKFIKKLYCSLEFRKH